MDWAQIVEVDIVFGKDHDFGFTCIERQAKLLAIGCTSMDHSIESISCRCQQAKIIGEKYHSQENSKDMTSNVKVSEQYGNVIDIATEKFWGINPTLFDAKRNSKASTHFIFPSHIARHVHIPIYQAHENNQRDFTINEFFE